jgi:hypothetical protein
MMENESKMLTFHPSYKERAAFRKWYSVCVSLSDERYKKKNPVDMTVKTHV